MTGLKLVKDTIINKAMNVLGPSPHHPTAKHVIYLWDRYGGNLENWDWDKMKEWNDTAPFYSVGVKHDNKMYALFQTGGGKAVNEFFEESEGQIPYYCDCGHIDIIKHRQSPFILVYPMDSHNAGCSRDPAELNARQIFIGLRWLLVAQVCNLLHPKERIVQ